MAGILRFIFRSEDNGMLCLVDFEDFLDERSG